MKKHILSFLMLSLCIMACSDDEVITNDTLNADLTSTVNIETVDITTATPNKAFDLVGAGLYQGIIVTEDAQFHGKIFVNVGNDGNYNALVETDTRERVSFKGEPLNRANTLFQFEGKRGSFVYDVTNYDSPVASEVVIDNTNGFVQTVKDRSEQRAAVALGTYADTIDPSFTGPWDLITDGTPAINSVGRDGATPIVLPLLTQVCILGPGGNMFVDNVFENHQLSGCFGGGTGFPPTFFFTDPTTDVDNINPASANEFWAWDQSVDILGQTLTYDLGQSSVISALNNFPGIGIVNDAFDPDTGDPVCAIFPVGVKGLWSWNGRSGSIFFPDPFELINPPPPVAESNFSADVNTISLPEPTLITK